MRLTYREQLLHPQWQRKRLERLAAANWTCCVCGAKDETLHVHHKQYLKGRMAWEYSDAELAVLCDPCHEQEHREKAELEAFLASMPVGASVVLRDLLRGYLASDAPESGDQPSAFWLGFTAMLVGKLPQDQRWQVVEHIVNRINTNDEQVSQG